MKHLVLIWAILGVSAFAEAQQFHVKQYSTEQGLGHNQVFDIHQDEDGFMWFGTDNGLYRFDGQEFYDMRRVDSAFDGSFTVLQQAKSGGFWAGIYKKQALKVTPKFNPSLGITQRMMPIGSDIIEDQGRFLSSIGQGVYTYQGDSVRLEFFRDGLFAAFPELQDNPPLLALLKHRMFQTTDKRNFLINRFGIFELADSTVKVLIPELKRVPLNCYAPQDEKGFWLGGRGRVYLIENMALVQEISDPDWKDKNIHFILSDRQNRLWISVMGEGVYVRMPDGHIQFMGDKIGLKDEFANYIFEDKDDNLWFATTNNGVFKVCTPSLKRIEGFADEYTIDALTIANANEVLVGANRQVHRIEGGKVSSNILPKHLEGEIQAFHSNSGKTYVCILTDEVKGRVRIVYPLSRELAAIIASNITTLKPDEILVWFSGFTSSNDFRLGPVKTWKIQSEGSWIKKMTFLYPPGFPWRTLNTNQSLLNEDGSIWVAQNKGLYLWQYPDSLPVVPLLKQDTKDLIIHPSGGILAATAKGIFFNQSRQDSSFSLFMGGISANCLAYDEANRLWVGSKEGLYAIDLSGPKPKIICRQAKGVLISCLAYDTAQNRLLIGTENGLYWANPAEMLTHTKQVPTVIVTELQTEDSTYYFPQAPVIPSDNNYLNFQFSGLEYRNADALQFSYRLNKRPWRPSLNQELQFASLADGDYVFEIKATTDGLNWSQPQTVFFTISPPFWKSPWVYAIISILSMGIIGLLAWQRVLNIKKREKEKRYLQQKLTELEQQALGALMNPHFIFNTLSSIQHFFNQRDPIDANEYLARFAQLIRLNMEVVQRPLTTLDEELDRLQIYLELEQLRFGDRMSYQLEIEPNIDTEEIMIPSMLMQPFVENAIWHGVTPSQDQGWVHVQLKMLDEKTLRIRIDDNGPGVFSSESALKSTHRSRGVEITRARLYHYSPQARLTFCERKDAQGKVLGTQVELRIPV